MGFTGVRTATTPVETDTVAESLPWSTRLYRYLSQQYGARLPYVIYGGLLSLLFFIALISNANETVLVPRPLNPSPSLRTGIVNTTSPFTSVNVTASTVPRAQGTVKHTTTGHVNSAQAVSSFWLAMFLSLMAWLILIQVLRWVRSRTLSYGATNATGNNADNRRESMQLLMQLMQMGHIGGGGGLGGAQRIRMALLQRDFTGDDYEMLQGLDDMPNGRLVRRGADQAAINQLPVHTVSLVEAAANVTEEGGPHTCNICLGPYEANEEQRILPCMHKFHKNCIDTWLRDRAICPVCKHRAIHQ